MQSNELDALQHALVQNWSVPRRHDAGSWDELAEVLARNIAFLIRHDLQRLFTICYLRDVAEKDVSEALRNSDVEEAARDVADMVLHREWQKLESRKRFMQEDSMDVHAEGDDLPEPD